MRELRTRFCYVEWGLERSLEVAASAERALAGETKIEVKAFVGVLVSV